MKRAPEICPYWLSGKHGQVVIRKGHLWWRKKVYVCPRCNAWYPYPL